MPVIIGMDQEIEVFAFGHTIHRPTACSLLDEEAARYLRLVHVPTEAIDLTGGS